MRSLKATFTTKQDFSMLLHGGTTKNMAVAMLPDLFSLK